MYICIYAWICMYVSIYVNVYVCMCMTNLVCGRVLDDSYLADLE